MPKVKKATLYRDSAKAVATILELYLLNALRYVEYLAPKENFTIHYYVKELLL
jgi:hypothetical protein